MCDHCICHKGEDGKARLGEGRWDHTVDAQIFTRLVKGFAKCSLWPVAQSPDMGTAVLANNSAVGATRIAVVKELPKCVLGPLPECWPHRSGVENALLRPSLNARHSHALVLVIPYLILRSDGQFKCHCACSAALGMKHLHLK